MRTPISLYFHIPFCHHKCGYCHFFVLPNKNELKDQLLEGLESEWRLVEPRVKGKKVISVYFGGGTPSLFGPERINTVLSWVRDYLAADAEITLEVNPEDATLQLLESYRTVGINRVSIGVQTLDDGLLQRLTRRHDAEKAKQAVRDTAAAGITNISIDLMYDVPGQMLPVWEDTLSQAIDLPITHLSLYNLTIEPYTAFAKREQQLLQLMPDAETSRQMYESAQRKLESGGLEQYEISAFARDGRVSCHNTGYWLGRSFLGLGPSAFSYWEGFRYRNVAHLGRYGDALKKGEEPVDFREQLDPAASQRELVAIQLRMRQGITMEKFVGLADDTRRTIQRLAEEGFLERKNDRWVLTQQGQLFYDTVATELV